VESPLNVVRTPLAAIRGKKTFVEFADISTTRSARESRAEHMCVWLGSSGDVLRRGMPGAAVRSGSGKKGTPWPLMGLINGVDWGLDTGQRGP
jgi:hypothetical protein